MLRFTRFLALVSIVRLGSAVAKDQVPFNADRAAPQTPQRDNTPFFPQDFSTDISEPQQTHAANTPIPSTIPTNPWLMTSPYETQEHLTNLSTLSLPSRLLTLALIHLNSTNSSYATIPYQDALNWPTVFSHLRTISDAHNHTWKSTIFYVVEFRSRLKPNIDRELLFKLDRESHREATASGGLVKYWFGKTSDDAEGRNLATCE